MNIFQYGIWYHAFLMRFLAKGRGWWILCLLFTQRTRLQSLCPCCLKLTTSHHHHNHHHQEVLFSHSLTHWKLTLDWTVSLWEGKRDLRGGFRIWSKLPACLLSNFTVQKTRWDKFDIARASPVVLSMWPWKRFFHIQLQLYVSFANPPIELKLVRQMGVGLVIANHLEQSLWCTNEKHWAAVRSYLLHSFLEVDNAAAPFTSNCRLYNFAEPNQHVLTFLHPILLCRITCWALLEML